MAANFDQPKQVEGQWEDLIRHPDPFVGRRVRVTVLPDPHAVSPLLDEIRRWLSEGDVVEIPPARLTPSDAFGDGLVEKFRKQGLVL